MSDEAHTHTHTHLAERDDLKVGLHHGYVAVVVGLANARQEIVHAMHAHLNTQQLQAQIGNLDTSAVVS